MIPTKLQNATSIATTNHVDELQKKNMQDTFTKSIDVILSDIGKHPVNKVNEIMELLNKNKVEYTYLEVNDKFEDAQNFKCIVKSDCINAYGIGFSKKDAKKNAAIDFINKLKSNFDNILKDEEKNCLAEPEVNYVGVLQNFCMAVPSQLPDYECIKDESINNMFIVKCHLYGYTTKGEGKSKQIAKKKAAALMYNQIKDMPRDRILKHYLNERGISSRVLKKMNCSANHTLMQPSKFSKKTNSYSVNHTPMQSSRISEKMDDSVNLTLMQPSKVSEKTNSYSVNHTSMQSSKISEEMDDSVNLTFVQPSKVSEKTNSYSVNHTSMHPSRISEKMNDSVNQTLQSSSDMQKYCNSKNHTITEEYNSQNSVMSKTKDSVFNNLDFFFDQIRSSKKPTLSRLRELKRVQLYTIDTVQMLYDIANEEDFTVNYESFPNHVSSKIFV
ncbi:Hypothetical protein CINCED_3A023679 [Cinara cedri]|uniref:DRBM domain-containing protein n=1 Tax=Cinara cedri TaxID=506608 RepID=A0A5E4NEW4_9HEMI|nr:Hypothetical protein CINCED_3A023679 [Cinara cedri]